MDAKDREAEQKKQQERNAAVSSIQSELRISSSKMSQAGSLVNHLVQDPSKSAKDGAVGLITEAIEKLSKVVESIKGIS